MYGETCRKATGGPRVNWHPWFFLKTYITFFVQDIDFLF